MAETVPLEEQLYTKEELRRLIKFATRLGFWNDVIHYSKLLKEMKEKS